MPTFEYNPQSYRWSSYRIVVADDVEIKSRVVRNVRLSKRESGNKTEYTVSPSGQWHGKEIDFSGEVKVSSASKNDAIIALASAGSWSGGSNYKGWVFGKPGAVIFMGRKGNNHWLVFTEDGIETTDIKPETKAVEL